MKKIINIFSICFSFVMLLCVCGIMSACGKNNDDKEPQPQKYSVGIYDGSALIYSQQIDEGGTFSYAALEQFLNQNHYIMSSEFETADKFDLSAYDYVFYTIKNKNGEDVLQQLKDASTPQSQSQSLDADLNEGGEQPEAAVNPFSAIAQNIKLQVDRKKLYHVSFDGLNKVYSNIEGEEISFPTDVLFKGGYTFKGWGKSNSAVLEDGHVINPAEFNHDELALKAVWSANVYEITLNKNDGSDDSQVVYLKYNDGYYSSVDNENNVDGKITNIAAPERTGYTFGGYANEGGDVVITLEHCNNLSTLGLKTFSAKTELNAVWVPNVYEINLLPYGGTGGTEKFYLRYGVGYYSSKEYAEDGGEEGKINQITIPSMDNYTLIGYVDGKTPAIDADECKDLSKLGYTKFSSNKTLTARWTANIYTITLDLNGGSGSQTEIYLKYGVGYYEDELSAKRGGKKGKITSIALPQKVGHFCDAFVFETGAPCMTGVADGKISLPSDNKKFTQDTTLYASWATDVYKITLDANGGSVGTEEMYLRYNNGYFNNETNAQGGKYGKLLAIITPTKTGHTFAGYANEGGDVVITPEKCSNLSELGNSAFSSDVTLKAVWVPNVYEIKLNANGGTAHTKAIYLKYGVGYYLDQACTNKTTGIDLPTKTGYSFVVFEDHGYECITKDNYNDLSKLGYDAFTQDAKLYAVWTPNVYRIMLNVNGGLGGTIVFYLKYGVGYYKEQACTNEITNITPPTKTGHTFGGYKQGDTVIVDEYGNIEIENTTLITDNIELAAIWTPYVTLGGAVTFVLKENDTEFVTRTVDDVLPGGEILQAVKLTADADTSPMLFRVKVVVNFTNGDLEPTDPNYFDGTTYEQQVLTAMGIDTTKWTLGTDGYYYYTNNTGNAVAVTAGNTVALTTGALVCPTSWTNEVANQPFTITIIAEAIQAANGAAHTLGWEYEPLAA